MGYIDPSICNGSGSDFMWDAAHLCEGLLKLTHEQG
jgi:hypothetical protein